MNKILSLATRKISYVPELNKFCTSIDACVLLVQIDYWFSIYPYGFYKFLSPSDHEKCRENDSWAEELNITAYQFRKSFDQYGVRYSSIKDFIKILVAGQDPFEGKFYLSVFDKNTKLTHYLRNHKIIDKAILSLFCDSLSGESDKNGGVNSTNNCKRKETVEYYEPFNYVTADNLKNLSCEMKRFYLLIEKILTWQIKNFKVPIYKEHNITTEITTKTIAVAMERGATEVMTSNNHQVAADSLLHSTELKNNIQKLPDNLKQRITQKARDYAKQYSAVLNNKSASEVFRLITEDLLDPNSWSQSGGDLHKKLNTIFKAIRDGQWYKANESRQLSSFTEKNEHQTQAIQRQVTQLKKRFHEEKGALSSLHSTLHHPTYNYDKSFLNSLVKEKSERELTIQSLIGELQTQGCWDAMQHEQEPWVIALVPTTLEPDVQAHHKAQMISNSQLAKGEDRC